jgi:uncharacterized Zn finger protein
VYFRLAPVRDVLYSGHNNNLATGENNMHCPKCNTTKGIEIDMHSDGYAKDLLECTACGSIWIEKSNEIITVTQQAA